MVLLDDCIIINQDRESQRGTDLRSNREEGNEIMDLGNKMSMGYQDGNSKMSIASLPAFSST